MARPAPGRPLPVAVRLPAHAPGLLASARVAQSNLLKLVPQAALLRPAISGRTVRRWVMIMDPEANNRVLREAVEAYPKSDTTRAILGPAIGEGMFTAEGEDWRWQRRAAAPAFTPRHMAALGPVMTRAAEGAVARLSPVADAGGGRAADLFAEMIAATFEVIVDVTLSDNGARPDRAAWAAMDRAVTDLARLSPLDLLGLPAWVPRPARARLIAQLAETRRNADALIAARSKDGPRPVPDLLDHLRTGEDGRTGRRMPADALRDNLLTFIVAGHETTALALAWALYLCAGHPEVQQAAHQEASAVLGQRAATAADVDRLPLIRRILDETMRLYPPAAILSRTARKADRLCGHPVHPGDTVILPVYALHRHRLLWDEPDAFRPDRFDGGTPVPRLGYLPFGAGPRICIGASFALQEAVIVLATLLARFRFDPVPGRVPEPVMLLTLRPEGGVWLRVSNA